MCAGGTDCGRRYSRCRKTTATYAGVACPTTWSRSTSRVSRASRRPSSRSPRTTDTSRRSSTSASSSQVHFSVHHSTVSGFAVACCNFVFCVQHENTELLSTVTADPAHYFGGGQLSPSLCPIFFFHPLSPRLYFPANPPIHLFPYPAHVFHSSCFYLPCSCLIGNLAKEGGAVDVSS